MPKFLSLTRVLLKNSMGMMVDGKSKKRSAGLLYAVLAICFLPLLGTLFMMYQTTMENLVLVGQAGSVLAVAFHISSFITFVFSIFLIPSIFYFSKDGETLLALPIKPQVILGSKFVVTLVYEYAFAFVILIPALIAYVQITAVSPLYYLFAIILFLLMPVYPLVFSSIITMLIMRFVPFFKNRDRFNMIAGILSVALALVFSVSLNSSSMDAGASDAMITSFLSGNNSLIEFFGYLFPGVPFAAKALVDASFLDFLLSLAITALSLLIFLTLGKYLYFKGVIGFNETGSNRKKLSSKDLKKLNTQHNQVRTYLWKELKLLIRTPVYFLNCIVSCAIMPIMIFAIMFTDTAALTAQIPMQLLSQLQPYYPYAFLVGLVIGIFLSNMNMISSTAISREGQNFVFMKYIPMALSKQIQAKVLSGILISVLSMVLMMISLYVVFPFLPIVCYLLVFLGSLVTIVLGNYLGILIDILHPKLVWEQEAAAVKQNMSGMIALFGCMAAAAGIGFLIYRIPFSQLLPYTIGITLALIILSIVLCTRMNSIAQRAFSKY